MPSVLLVKQSSHTVILRISVHIFFSYLSEWNYLEISSFNEITFAGLDIKDLIV